MSSSYLRRVRLVCNGWAAFAGRFCTDLKPEYLPDGGRRLATRFPYLRLLDLSHCSEIVIHAKVLHPTSHSAFRAVDMVVELQTVPDLVAVVTSLLAACYTLYSCCRVTFAATSCMQAIPAVLRLCLR